MNRFLFIDKKKTSGYSLRDIGPAGGYIFYINPNSEIDGWTYLESYPTVINSTGSWTSSELSGITNGNTLLTIGSGYDNTQSILNQVGYEGNSCPKYCVDLDNGYSDWFMPSFDEVGLLRTNLYLYGLGGFVTSSYWTSSEYDAEFAYRYNISTGESDHTHQKTKYYAYRAIRKF